jgi:hypothetical protein
MTVYQCPTCSGVRAVVADRPPPKCERCGVEMMPQNKTAPTKEEGEWLPK